MEYNKKEIILYKIEQKIEWLKKNMPSFDEEDEKRIHKLIVPLILEGATKENFREKALQKDPGFTGRDYFLFVLLTQEDIEKFIKVIHQTVEKSVKKKV